MAHKYDGGCDHVHTHADADPMDDHICHCSVCKRVTGQPSTHVVFFNHGDLAVDNPGGTEPRAVQRPEPQRAAGAVHLRRVRHADHARRQATPDTRGRAKPDGLRSRQPAGDLSCLLRRIDRRGEAGGRPSRIRRVAPGFRLADAGIRPGRAPDIARKRRLFEASRRPTGRLPMGRLAVAGRRANDARSHRR